MNTIRRAEELADVARDLTRSELERLMAITNLLQIAKAAIKESSK